MMKVEDIYAYLPGSEEKNILINLWYYFKSWHPAYREIYEPMKRELLSLDGPVKRDIRFLNKSLLETYERRKVEFCCFDVNCWATSIDKLLELVKGTELQDTFSILKALHSVDGIERGTALPDICSIGLDTAFLMLLKTSESIEEFDRLTEGLKRI